MGDLTSLRDHARFMARRDHTSGCPPVRSKPGRASGGDRKWCAEDTPHDAHEWREPARFGDTYAIWQCAGICGGCQTDKEIDLWNQIADEIDVYLTPMSDFVDLFGEISTEPTIGETA